MQGLRRTLSGTVLAVFAFYSPIAGGAPAHEATGSARAPAGTKLISASLSNLRSGDRILDLSGENRPGFPGSYVVNVRLHRLPCGGRYRYMTFGEDLTDGASTSLEAELKVRRVGSTPPGLRCGRPLPRHLRLPVWARLFNADERPLTLTARRRLRKGSVRAILDLAGTLECGKPYSLLVGISVRRTRRVYRYAVDVLAAAASVDNTVERVDNCKLATGR